MSIKDKYKVISIKPSLCKEWLLYKHYAHRIPSISYSFGLYDNDNNLQGVCTFGVPAILQWTNLYLELNRLVVNDGLDKNVLSYFVSHALNLIDRDVIVVSFADPNNGHHGYIYQATNWIYTGVSGKSFNWLMDGKEYHQRHINKQDDIFKKVMSDRNINIVTEKTIKELWELGGGICQPQNPKHRYFFIVTKSKDFRNKSMEFIKTKYNILPYPKGENKRYDASYQTTNQETLFI